MKVKCINMGYQKDTYNLTIGKIYDVIYIYGDGDYIIVDDSGDDMWYPMEYFKSLSKIRNDTINKLLEDEN